MQFNELDTHIIGLIISLYFITMLLGATYSKNLIKNISHIRMFSGSVVLIAVSILVCVLDSIRSANRENLDKKDMGKLVL